MVKYNTRQKDEILELINNFENDSFSADDLIGLLRMRNSKVGRSTVYRLLSELNDAGMINKFRLEDGVFRYQLIKSEQCAHHMHLCCIKCGKTIHLDCNSAREFENHLIQDHGFYIIKKDSMILGLCENCRKER